MSRPAPLLDILSRIGNDSGHRSECLIPVDDDWKEQMRIIAQNAKVEDKESPLSDEE